MEAMAASCISESDAQWIWLAKVVERLVLWEAGQHLARVSTEVMWLRIVFLRSVLGI